MKSKFSSYEQSLELYKLGFVDDCFGWYEDGNLVMESVNSDFYYLHYSMQVLAPLKAQAFDWIRENYGLCHFVNFSGKNYCSGWEDKDFNEFGYGVYDTYQEAESQCLTKLIKFAKKVKKESSKNTDIVDSKDLDFSKLNSTEKDILINSKLTKRIDLNKDEFQYLSNDKKDEYINDFAKSGFHMQKWLWNKASDIQKSMYLQCRIDKKYKLQDYEFYYASESQKDTYIGNRIKNGYDYKKSSQII